MPQVFSPNLKYLVSVGYQHDMLVNVWSWKVQYKWATGKGWVGGGGGCVGVREGGLVYMYGGEDVEVWVYVRMCVSVVVFGIP